MKNDLTSLEHLRQAALEARGLIGAVANTAAEAVEEVAALLPVRRTLTLTAAGWSGSGPFVQTAAVDGVRADEAGQLVLPAPAEGSLTAWNEAGVQCTGQEEGMLMFTAQEKPGVDLRMFVVLQEVTG